jgi:hypothetical protein
MEMYGEWRLTPPFLTSALNGSEWLTSRPGRFTVEEFILVPIGYEAEWPAELVLTYGGEKNLFLRLGI